MRIQDGLGTSLAYRAFLTRPERQISNNSEPVKAKISSLNSLASLGVGQPLHRDHKPKGRREIALELDFLWRQRPRVQPALRSSPQTAAKIIVSEGQEALNAVEKKSLIADSASRDYSSPSHIAPYVP